MAWKQTAKAHNGRFVGPITRRTQAVLIKLVVCALVASFLGCRDLGLREAVEAIAKRLSPANQAIVGRLRTCPNPQGEGTIVFVRSDTDCGPQYAWLSLDSSSEAYALDETSRGLTPSLKTLVQAADDSRRRAGFQSSPTFDAAVK